MKRFIITLYILPVLAFSQNYQTVNPEVDSYYEAESNFNIDLWFKDIYDLKPVRCISIVEQTIINNDLILFNYPEIHDNEYLWIHWTGDPCVYLDMPSWIGERILLRDNGDNYFFNRNNDSILIQTNAQLNDSWKFFKYPDQSYFLATIDEVNTIDLWGISDSIKQITLQFYNSNNEPTASNLNNTELIISKDHGFIKVINFRDFPDFGYDSYQVLEHTLVGQKGLTDMYHLMTRADIYNFIIGDEFHHQIKHEVTDFTWYQWEIRKVIEKEMISTDEIAYTLVRDHWGYEYFPGSPLSHDYDTVMETYSELSNYVQNTASFQPYEYDENIYLYSMLAVDNYNGRPRILTTTDTYSDYNNCISHDYFDSFGWWSNEYIKGCGTSYCSWTEDGGEYFQKHTNDLVYFKKGEETWGTPLTAPSQLYPIQDLQFDHWYVTPNNYYNLSWEIPEPSVDTLMGYNIYRDAELYTFQSETYLSHTEAGGNGTEGFLMYGSGEPFYIHVTAVYNYTLEESIYNDSVYCDGLAIGIKELSNGQLNIFPNPATNTISITNPSGLKILCVTLYTHTGLKIISNKAPINTIDISDLEAGLYFVEIKTNEGDVRKKIIVQ